MTQRSQQDPLPDVIESRRAHDGFFGLRVDRLRFADGRESTSEVIEHPGGITLVALDNQGRVLLVRQYRHPCGRWLLELPAGTLELGEAPEVCAERELQEEAGYRPGRLRKLGGFYLAPGYCTEYQTVFLCTGLSESKLEGDEDAIHVERLSIEAALGCVRDGQIEDAKTAAALLLYLRAAELGDS